MVEGLTIQHVEEFYAEFKRMNENLEFIAAGIAKLAERCFCGHRLDQHTPECTQSGCRVSAEGTCQSFTPWFLALARVANFTSLQFADFKELIATIAGASRPEGQSGIVKPFTH